jgi:hypothetical protein
MGDLSVMFFNIFNRKLFLKITQTTEFYGKRKKTHTDHQFLDLIVASLGLAAKMCTNSKEHSMTIRFLWSEFKERVASTF